MTWVELDEAIRLELLGRELKNPRIRLGALENLGRTLKSLYPEISGRAELLLDVGKQALSSRLAQRKQTGALNGAEKSALNQIFDLLQNRAISRPRVSSEKHEQRHVKIRSISESPNVSKAGLRPLIWDDSTILVLGTLPGDESIRLQQYYANPSNEFWKILSAVYGQAIDSGSTNRIAFLRSKGLALWDVLKSAKRIGSSDRSIKNAVPNDFSQLLTVYRRLTAIVFNGGEARKLFLRHVERSVGIIHRGLIQTLQMPSSSGNPGRYVPPCERKAAAWRVLTRL